jgi:DNA-binding HxlR family transcriptional regulator
VDRIKYKNRISICACKVSLDIVGDKWSLIIVRDLFRGRNTYSQFLNESNEGIASNVLNDRLKKLTEYQIINFRINPEDKKIKEYYLTDRGIDLYDIIYELQSWTIDNVDFNHSKNTEEFIKLNQSKSKKVIISNNKKKYRKLRLEKFGE